MTKLQLIPSSSWPQSTLSPPQSSPHSSPLTILPSSPFTTHNPHFSPSLTDVPVLGLIGRPLTCRLGYLPFAPVDRLRSMVYLLLSNKACFTSRMEVPLAQQPIRIGVFGSSRNGKTGSHRYLFVCLFACLLKEIEKNDTMINQKTPSVTSGTQIGPFIKGSEPAMSFIPSSQIFKSLDLYYSNCCTMYSEPTSKPVLF